MSADTAPALAPAPDLSSPPRIAPVPRLSGNGLLLALLVACLLPLTCLSLYAIFIGRATQRPLPVKVEVVRELVPTADGGGAIPIDVIAVTNLSDVAIPNVTMDINGQYFLNRDAPLMPGDRVVILQSIFATKANQRWVPGRYAIRDVTVTGQLPGGARGVTEVRLDAAARQDLDPRGG